MKVTEPVELTELTELAELTELMEPMESKIGFPVSMYSPMQASTISTPITAAASSSKTATAIGSDPSRVYCLRLMPAASADLRTSTSATQKVQPSSTTENTSTPTAMLTDSMGWLCPWR